MQRKMIEDIGYPRNFLTDVGGFNGEYLPEDIEGTIYYLASRRDPRAPEMIILRYKYNTTFSKIGLKFGITAEMARQLLMSILRFFRQPYRFAMLKIGMKEYAFHERRLIAENSELKKSIRDMDLPVRLLHSLLRYGCSTIEDVVKLYVKFDGALVGKVRNMGVKNLRDLEERFGEYLQIGITGF